jgi:hypothetical protein
VEASGVHGDEGHRRASDARTEAEALTRQSSAQRNRRKANRRGYMSPHDRPRVK